MEAKRPSAPRVLVADTVFRSLQEAADLTVAETTGSSTSQVSSPTHVPTPAPQTLDAPTNFRVNASTPEPPRQLRRPSRPRTRSVAASVQNSNNRQIWTQQPAPSSDLRTSNWPQISGRNLTPGSHQRMRAATQVPPKWRHSPERWRAMSVKGRTLTKEIHRARSRPPPPKKPTPPPRSYPNRKSRARSAAWFYPGFTKWDPQNAENKGWKSYGPDPNPDAKFVWVNRRPVCVWRRKSRARTEGPRGSRTPEKRGMSVRDRVAHLVPPAARIPFRSQSRANLKNASGWTKRPASAHIRREISERRPDNNCRRPDNNCRRPDNNGRRPDNNGRRPSFFPRSQSRFHKKPSPKPWVRKSDMKREVDKNLKGRQDLRKDIKKNGVVLTRNWGLPPSHRVKQQITSSMNANMVPVTTKEMIEKMIKKEKEDLREMFDPKNYVDDIISPIGPRARRAHRHELDTPTLGRSRSRSRARSRDSSRRRMSYRNCK